MTVGDGRGVYVDGERRDERHDVIRSDTRRLRCSCNLSVRVGGDAGVRVDGEVERSQVVLHRLGVQCVERGGAADAASDNEPTAGDHEAAAEACVGRDGSPVPLLSHHHRVVLVVGGAAG